MTFIQVVHERTQHDATIAAILTARIESGRYQPRRRIASKREAIEDFGVADHTYDRAVALLRDAGLIESVKGKGSFVTER